ncbi:MAG: ribosome biogenesis GTPase YlqF [Cyanobacteria bacterium]|nr:ribosome biogenesis GTPase YlqF [Cyanobacteriota bacterium]MDA1021253.1 ribosome biogenesis GTPase YlqF [Cyanobacteriota bacterium]
MIEEEPQKKLNKFNWYPGHIAKAERQLKEKLKVIDIVIELRDARIPEASKHKDLAQWANNKPIITVINKADLAPPNDNYISINSKETGSLKRLIKEIEKASKPILEKYLSKGVIGRATKVMVVGYPNVGKSSLINALTKNKKKAKVADKAGVTRQQQWIDTKSKLNIKLLDTPGIIPAKFYSEDQALKLALCNCLGDNAYDHVLVAKEGMLLLEEATTRFYGIEFREDPLAALAIKKSMIRNGTPDIDRAADLFLKDFREAKLGRISLD